uniref:Uncharacterized protein n=1 Tax=Caenorhabditis japonica TaxID=281687 RepID=A0A8R1DK43_CAEJA
MRISSREIPHLQQAIWNVAGELYQRQKDVETDGSMYQIQQKQKPGEELEAQRMLAKISKMKDMASLRYLFERGLLTERHVPREPTRKQGILLLRRRNCDVLVSILQHIVI